MYIKYVQGIQPREGVIIECPLNGQYHDRRGVILTSQMAVSNQIQCYAALFYGVCLESLPQPFSN